MIISELYPAPNDGFEWVELCNDSDISADLSEYSLYDATGKALTLPNISLDPGQYVLATSSGVLNNSGDTITLSRNGTAVDTVTYSSSLDFTQSLVFCEFWITTQSITPGYENPLCESIEPTATPVVSKKPAVSATPTTVPALTTPQKVPEESATQLETQIFSTKHGPVLLAEPSITITPSPTQQEEVLGLHKTEQSVKKVDMHPLHVVSISFAFLALVLILIKLAPKIKEAYNEQL